MLKRLTRVCVAIAERYLPDPLVIAILLTGVSFVAAVTFTDFTPGEAVDAWGTGYWTLLRFTAQMILVLGLGHVLANTRPAHQLLVAIAQRINSATVAYVGITLIASAAALVSWGLGLIVPAILARIVAENCRARGIRIHFPLLVACSYCGNVVNMQGLSSSIALVVNTPGHFLEESIGRIGLDQTIFSAWNLAIVATILVVLPLLLRQLEPEDHGIVEIPATAAAVDLDTQSSPSTAGVASIAVRLENSRGVTLALALFGGWYVTRFFVGGGSLQLDSLNMIFVVLGLALADSPRHYIELLSNAAKVAGPFLIQYPLYSGMMGLIADSGLGTLIVGGFVSVSTTATLPIWAFFSAAFLNLFIPSAGGQWAVQGPIVTEAALQLGANVPRVTMAVVVGEVWTNLIQPLYVVPVLAIAGLNLRDIMGYCVIALLAVAPIYLTALVLF
ncbi:MAG: TIGR00366 family protein [Myxococcota bacterium]